MNHFVPSLTTANEIDIRSYESLTTTSQLEMLELPIAGFEDRLVPTDDVTFLNINLNLGFFGNQIQRRFGRLTDGAIRLITSQGSTLFGDSSATLQPVVSVANDAFFKRVFWGGTIGSAESYMDGEWATTDLTALIRVMIRNLGTFSQLEKTWARFKNKFHFLQHVTRKNTVEGSRRNIHEHYDLGNDFYQLFLDPTMNYSSGIFASEAPNAPDADQMEDASFRKMDELCQRLELSPKDHVLEIGTGWGGLSMHMAKHYGCRVTTTTISQEQYNLAVARIEENGLGDRITVLLKDYRDLEGKFDKIVSVEMIEAVGHQYYDTFFGQAERLLNDGGRILLQAITIGERNFDYHIGHVDFIRKYVFPGGCLPSVTALAESVGRVTNMRMTHQRDITPHYVKTLAYWRRQFMAKLETVRELGYSDKFIRLWHFYLCYCEAAFAEQRVHCVHLMFAKPSRHD